MVSNRSHTVAHTQGTDGGINGRGSGVSDYGTGAPPARYKVGAKCEAKGKDKRRKYIQQLPHDQPRRALLPQLRAYG